MGAGTRVLFLQMSKQASVSPVPLPPQEVQVVPVTPASEVALASSPQPGKWFMKPMV